MNKIHILHLHNMPIYEQLQLEEALLRVDSRNWCILNEGTPPAIVMGISGKPELLINNDFLLQWPIPVIRRFSGGGTVVVDENTLFITFICNSEMTQVCCPEKIHKWTENIYKPVFSEDFHLLENDYVFGNRKFGGNAQYIRKDRWLHHSSLLWDFDLVKMKYLQIPQKTPKYRQLRNHEDFLCRLKEFYPHKEGLKKKLFNSLEKKFSLIETQLETVRKVLLQPHRQATTLIIGIHIKKLLKGASDCDDQPG